MRTEAGKWNFVLWALPALASSFSLLACGGKSSQIETPSSQPLFGGSYENLLPEQRHLLEKWVAEYDEIMGEDLTPADIYPKLPLSTRTTFEAVTHALTNTELTDESGKSLGRAIDLVETVEAFMERSLEPAVTCNSASTPF